MARLAPELDGALLDEAVEHLAPIWEALEAQDPEALLDVEPAVGFDAVAAAGPLPPPRPLPPAPAPTRADPPASPGELPWLSLCDQADLLRRRELNAAELAGAHLERIAALQPRLNAFITVTADLARSPVGGTADGPLGGVPVGIKDIIATAGVRTTGGSRILADNVPDADAACWARLRAAGAVLLGKLNTHEFAAGATNENPHYGPARNPWDTARVTGGSSGGSGAAVAAAMVAGALGSDTGGSIRIPAACCGVVGIKPTYGRVPRDGVLPLAWSLDHVGPLARSVRDAALLLDVIAGEGSGGAPGGRAAACEPAARAGAAAGLSGWRVGVPRAWLADGVEPGVRSAFEAALDELRRLGAEVADVELPARGLLAAVNRAIAFAEATSWHSGFLRDRAGLYGANVRPRMEAGRFLTAAEYLLAQRLRAEACRSSAALWAEVDVLALPTLPAVAPPIGARAATAALIVFTAPFNVLGAPAVSLPCGFGEGGLPVGLQVVAPPGRDAQACFVAAAYEAATDWHRRRPPVDGPAAR